MVSYDLSLLSLFRYSILDKDCPIGINPITGQLSTLRKLDRELEATHVFQVKAQEEPSGASHNHLLMLFLLNNRSLITTMCHLGRDFREDGVFPSALLDLLRNGCDQDLYKFNLLPPSPGKSMRERGKITLPALPSFT